MNASLVTFTERRSGARIIAADVVDTRSAGKKRQAAPVLFHLWHAVRPDILADLR